MSEGKPTDAADSTANGWSGVDPGGGSGQKRLDGDLATAIKWLLFPVEGPRIASEDPTLFQSVMTEFHRFEETGERGENTVKRVFSTLNDRCEATFERDFLFYIALAYRTRVTKSNLYRGDVVQRFVGSCIVQFGRLYSTRVANVLKCFFERGDFTFDIKLKQSTDSDVPVTSVFLHLENAFGQLMNERKVVYHIYPKVLWITTYLSFCAQRPARDSEADARKWHDHFLKDAHQYILDDNNVDGLMKTLVLGQDLKLPLELTFKTSHVGELLAPVKASAIRPFHHQRNTISALEQCEQCFISEQDFVQHVLIKLRQSCVISKHKNLKKFLNAASDGSKLQCIIDGLHLLDSMLQVATTKWWTSLQLDEEFEEWLLLLLSLIDFDASPEAYLHEDKSSPRICLQEILSPEYSVVKRYHKFIDDEIVELMRTSLKKLSVEQFLEVYQSGGHIWPPQILEDYLDSYILPQYMKISDAVWKTFMQKVSERFLGAAKQKLAHRFLLRVAAYYKEKQKPANFIPELLQLGVDGLFSVQLTDWGQPAIDDQQAAADFENDLREYIYENKLKSSLISQTKKLMDCISTERNSYQDVVLAAAYKEMIPEADDLLNIVPLNQAIDTAVRTVTEDQTWVQHEPSKKQQFCLGFINACCKRIPVSSVAVEWISKYLSTLKKLGSLYCSYSQLSSNQTLLCDAIPAEIANSSSPSVQQYFEWVRRLHSMLSDWKSKLENETVNYDEIHSSLQNQRCFRDLAQAVGATSLMFPTENLKSLHRKFLEEFGHLNQLLLKYIPDDPEGGWCSVLNILSEYGTEIPQSIQSELRQCILFPDESENASTIEHLANIPSPSSSGRFNPHNENIHLRLSSRLGFASLRSLGNNLEDFLSPIAPNMELLVYFKLQRSKLFTAYMHHALNTIAESTVTIACLCTATDQVKELLIKVLEGVATYGEIVAGDSLDLEQLEAESEFNILEHCPYIQPRTKEGLSGMKCLLKLIQFTKPIQKICDVCSQYHLEKCLSDPKLLELTALIEMLDNGEERSQITAIDAKLKWKMVYETLCLEADASPRSLELFDKVADSADFYHFLEENKFTGAKGYSRFVQELERITRQLEQEEYQEVVLIHLFTAFKFIAPFTDPSHESLHALMSDIRDLKPPDRIPQFETVKKNIQLIRVWFSQSEDTLKSVLDNILKNGEYQITATSLAHERRPCAHTHLRLILKYKPSSSIPGKRVPFLKQTSMSIEPSDCVTQQADHTEQNQTEEMTVERLNDFVHKLGFLDTIKEEDKKVQDFLQLNEVAYQLLELFGQLRELGHPEYFGNDFSHTLLCSASQRHAQREMTEVDAVRRKWVVEIERVHGSNKLLVFFGVPKLMILNDALSSDPPCVYTITEEIVFLCKRDMSVRERIRAAVQCSVDACRVSHRSSSERLAMDVVGSFLHHLFSLEDAKHWLLPICSSSRNSETIQSSANSQLVSILHCATDYTQSMLIRLVLEIYSGPPEAFEIFHCKPETSEQEVKLFMKRMSHYPRQYLILEINRLPYQRQEVLLQMYLQLRNEQQGNTVVHFIETAPSVLREVPWLKVIEYGKEGPSTGVSEAQNLCQKARLMSGKDWSCIELVYSVPGNGKTHYINEKLKSIPKTDQVTVTVNEAFTSVMAIENLCSLSRHSRPCGIFFNFTILPPVPGASEVEEERYHKLMNEVGWFFFNLLILRYVEDPITGESFHFPGGLSWQLYIEIPSRATNEAPHGTAAHYLEHFKNEVSALALLGRPVHIGPSYEYRIDEDVQLVCKYLRAYSNGRINTLYDGIRGPIKFSTATDLSDQECRELLLKYMPSHIKETKISQKLFVQYMKRRCIFLDNLPAFNYNSGMGEFIVVSGRRKQTDTSQLGSTLMQAMLKEVADFVDPKIKDSWSQKGHQQLIYDFKDGGGSLDLISLFPDEIPMDEKAKFVRIGVEIPSMADLYTRDVLDKYLSRALNIPLSKDHRLSPIDERQYVLTLDYTLKMLSINERYECGIPVIIVGETGVGKTALIEMLSQLWNYSWLAEWDRDKDRILDKIRRKMGDLDPDDIDDTQRAKCVEAMDSLNSGKQIREEMLEVIAQLPDDRNSSGQLYSVLNESLCKLEGDPKFSILSHGKRSVSDAFAAIKAQDSSAKSTAHLMYIIFSAKVKSVFHKLNIHSALQVKKIKEFFAQVFVQANEIEEAYNACNPSMRPSFKVPFVTAYLDEINTASCLGLLKEIIVDRTIDGKPIPQNVFIVASCNPHRGDILAATHDHESWLKGTYNVRKLHPTLQFLMWDYGSLNEFQEREYVNAKMTLLNQKLFSEESSDFSVVFKNQAMPSGDIASLTDLIVESQMKMRQYAREQLMQFNVPPDISVLCAKSCVSQRDIQRVFTFYQWLMKLYIKISRDKVESEMHHRRAIMVSLGLVYYMRLNQKYRDEYRTFLDKFDRLSGEVDFSEAYNSELSWFINQVELPPGIAKTEALMENVFATIACIMTHTPLIIVGEPGSSKTLSFNIVVANFKGRESKNKTFRHTDIFQSLDPYFYQCSHRTTSNEVERIFRRAILRQHDLAKISLPVSCVVFMDEAGLPNEKLQSLKVLHYYLDRQEVAFVAISNHVLDAAKTNRAVSLFRPKQTHRTVYELAKEIMAPVSQRHTPVPEEQLHAFCHSYITVIQHKQFRKYFGLRDFIHFVTYLHRRRKLALDEPLILEALERNFNGSQNFKHICQIFSQKMGISFERCHFRSILKILEDSLADHSSITRDDVHNSIQSEIRYKLIIDPSEDDSLIRLLFTYGVLQRESTRLYVCSDFPGDDQLRVNTIARIRHSVAAGHTILMCQTDEIHENFYDLFNQRFRSIEDPEHGTRYYANIAIGAHSKPCRVDPNFQCVIVIKESEVQNTPAPFLNRFEKYYLTHQSLLETVLSKMPPCLRILLKAAHRKAADFISCVKQSSFYGCTKHGETLDSLMLALLPPTDHVYKALPQQSLHEESYVSENINTFALRTLQEMLGKCAGFKIPQYIMEEVNEDADHIFKLVLRDSEFKGVMAKITRENVAAVINEALHVLHNSPDPSVVNAPLEIHGSACIVIAVLMQWLVCYLCKRLMQLMTPEALAVHCQAIPNLYVRNYLKFQEHFNLKELVERHLEQLHRNDWDSTLCSTKLLCFTRSSPSIHKLPTEYPMSATSMDLNLEEALKEHVFTDLEHLMIHKVSIEDSQRELEKLLAKFVTSNYYFLLLIANMQELTKKMVNHLRIMIEEAENTVQSNNKLFVILLHFPAAMFFNSCYPSLFMQGWGHHYLDTISSDTLHVQGVKSAVDVKEWFHYCCFPDSVPTAIGGEEYMPSLLKVLIPEAIPIIAAKVPFWHVNDDANVVLMTASQRTHVLQNLLIKGSASEHLSDSDEMHERKNLGAVLILKFREYWTPQLMVQQINQVSKLMYAQESTLNVTDYIQSIVRSAFFDFLVYIFTKMTEEQDINILLDCENGSPAINELFFDLVRALPIPELKELKVTSATIKSKSEQNTSMCRIPRFPFFKHVCRILEEAISENKETVNRYSDILEDPQSRSNVHQIQRKSKEELYKEAIMARVQGRKDCLVVAADAMDSDDGEALWTRYFEEFTHCKLHLDSEVSPLLKKILEAYIGPLENTDALSRLVSLHVRVHLLQLDLNKLTRILKPLSTLQEEMEASCITVEPTASLVSATFPVHSVGKAPPNFASHIVGMLFKFLSQTAATDINNLASWYRCYADIMSIRTMEENIFNSIDSRDASFETQLNIMHTTYLVIQCSLDSSAPIARGYEVFQALHSEYCGPGAKKSDSSPQLHEIVAVGLKEMGVIPMTLSIHGKRAFCLQSFMEGLFAFFFSKHRRHVLSRGENCIYFLNIANQQNSFCSGSAEIAMFIPGDGHLDECTTISLFKLYLSRILGEIECGKKSQGRELVGRMLTASDIWSPGPYIPTFYQLGEKVCTEHSCEAARNPIMQQPLAHLYFLTVFEKLGCKGHQTKHLVRLAGKLTEALQNDVTPRAERVLLFIEKQAVVQVLIQQVAVFFAPKHPKSMNQDLFSDHLINGINPLFSDESMGGSRTSVSWYGLTLAMQLQKQLRSSKKLIEVLCDDQSTLLKTISVVRPLRSLIQVRPWSDTHSFPFIAPKERPGELGSFYQQICMAMTDATRGKLSRLVQLAENSCSSTYKMQFPTTSGNVLIIEKKNAFRMLLWLCTYNNIYTKKIHLKSLADAVSDSFKDILEPQLINLLKCFIYPKYMEHFAKVPDGDVMSSLEMLTESMQFMSKEVEGARMDPLLELFHFSPHQDPSEMELCHSMANMVAVVLACEPCSNHLWYHMFAANELSGSHMTGFMYDTKICEGFLYDSGVELTSEGTHGRPDYLPHATRGTLSLHSLYLILWVNFGAFCMALLTQPDAQQKISGPVISASHPIRHYCATQLQNVWIWIGKNLKMSLEEQSFFLMQCMEKFLEVSVSQQHLLEKGRFEDLKELDVYERVWHNHIFTPSLENFEKKFAEYSHLWDSQLLRDIRCIETYYPHFPTMVELSNTLLSSTAVNNTSNELYVLSKFILEHSHLQVAGALLPDLLELYHWIHTDLAYLIPRQYAQEHTIEEVITKVDNKYPALNLQQLYERVKDGYNRYLGVIGANGSVNSERRITQIEDGTMFIHFLSTETNSKLQVQGGDLLYHVINELITFHNGFVQNVFDAVTSSENSSLKYYFPEQLDDFVDPTEVTEDAMILPKSLQTGEINEQLLLLVCSRHLQQTQHGSCPFDLHRLQRDVVKAYLAGKPLIRQSPSVRIPFKFRDEHFNTLSLHDTNLELCAISQNLTMDFRLKLDEEYAKELEYEFHSANYHMLIEVVTGLKIAAEYLIKSQHNQPGYEFRTSSSVINLKEKKLPQFLILIYNETELDGEEEAMKMIGIKSVSPTQMACLLTLKLPYLYSTLELFSTWVKNGLHDFHHLPLAMKKHLEPQVEECLDKIDTTSQVTPSTFFHDLTEIMARSEAHIKRTIAENMQKPIKEFLKELHHGKNGEVAELIPDSVLCQHYVALRVFLRRRMTAPEVKIHKYTISQKQLEEQEIPWLEFVDNLWAEENLKHLRDAAMPYDYNSRLFDATEEYGFHTEAVIDKEEKEPLLFEHGEDEEQKEEEQKEEEEATESIPVEELKKAAEEITVEEVANFLSKINLEKHVALFKENDIDGVLLLELSLDNLNELGISNGFECRKILTKFRQHMHTLISK